MANYVYRFNKRLYVDSIYDHEVKFNNVNIIRN